MPAAAVSVVAVMSSVKVRVPVEAVIARLVVLIVPPKAPPVELAIVKLVRPVIAPVAETVAPALRVRAWLVFS